MTGGGSGGVRCRLRRARSAGDAGAGERARAVSSRDRLGEDTVEVLGEGLPGRSWADGEVDFAC